MALFSVPITISNYEDMIAHKFGRIGPLDIRRTTLNGVIDPEATRMVIPLDLSADLGFHKHGQVKLILPGREVVVKDKVEDVHLQIGEREGVFTAIVVPEAKEVVVGAIALSELDYLIDTENQRLLTRDPDFPTEKH